MEEWVLFILVQDEQIIDISAKIGPNGANKDVLRRYKIPLHIYQFRFEKVEAWRVQL